MQIEPLRVLHVLGTMGYGGVETWLMQIFRRIDRTEFQFGFCLTGSELGAYAPEIEAMGGMLVPCPLEKRNPLSFSRRFQHILWKGKFQVVHSHNYFLSGWVSRMAHKAGVPIRISHSHNTSDGKRASTIRDLYRATMRRWIWEHATHGLAASAEAAKALFGPNWQSDSRFRVLHCGIDLEPFRQNVTRPEVRRELGIPEDAPVVGHVGRFMPQKNHAFLLQVAAEVLKLRPEVRFLLVGDGVLRPQMEALARELGIEKNVVFPGPRSDVPRLMLGAMDVFLFPSLWEGLPIAFLEAQAAGLGCVVSRSVPAEALILRESLTYLSLSVSAAEWGDCILRLLERPRIAQRTAVQMFAQTDFTVEKSCQYLARLYDSMAPSQRIYEEANA